MRDADADASRLRELKALGVRIATPGLCRGLAAHPCCHEARALVRSDEEKPSSSPAAGLVAAPGFLRGRAEG
jgi:hypothetical protein